MDQYINIDQALTAWLRGVVPHNTFFDLFFSIISFRNIGFFLFISAIIAVYLYEKNGHHFTRHLSHSIFITLFSTGASFFISDVFLKPFIMRLRPVATEVITIAMCPTSFSFPSGHAAMAFAAATILSLLDANKKRAVLYVGIAVLISYSRIYLGCHYLLDVLGGAMLGTIIGILIYKFPPFFTSNFPRGKKHASN